MGSIEPCAVAVAERQQQNQIEVADDAEAYYAPMRMAFLERRIDEQLSTHGGILSLLTEGLDSSLDTLIGITLRDAVKESGINWDGITAFEGLIRGIARKRAAEEWDATPRDFESDRREDQAEFERG